MDCSCGPVLPIFPSLCLSSVRAESIAISSRFAATWCYVFVYVKCTHDASTLQRRCVVKEVRERLSPLRGQRLPQRRSSSVAVTTAVLPMVRAHQRAAAAQTKHQPPPPPAAAAPRGIRAGCGLRDCAARSSKLLMSKHVRALIVTMRSTTVMARVFSMRDCSACSASTATVAQCF